MPDRIPRLRVTGSPARPRAGVVALAGRGARPSGPRSTVHAQLRALHRENVALRERDRRWDALHDASNDGVMAFVAVRDAERRIVDFEWLYANAAAARIVGRPADWFPSRRLLVEMPGNRVEGLFDAYVDVVERGRIWTGESRYAHEGVDAWLRVVATRTGDGFSVTFADLGPERPAVDDALERVELALRESRERFTALCESVPMPIWTSDASGAVDYLNRRWFEYTGQDTRAARGQGWAEAVHPDDRDALVAAWNAAVASGTPYVCDYRLRGADGRYRWFQSRATAQRGRDGAVERWFGACIDVHELSEVREALERTAERLRAATDAAGLGILELDAASGEVRLDARAAALWGVPADRPATLDQLAAAIHPDDRARTLAAVDAGIRGDPGRVELEHRVVGRDGDERWVRTTGHARRDGRLAVAIVGTAQDIGPQKATEFALREVDRRKDRFLAILSHELRNPFAPIRNAARVLQVPGASDAQRTWAREVIQRQVAHVSLLLDDLLDLARIKQGKLSLRRAEVVLDEVVAAAVEVARPLLESRGHALSVSLPDPAAVVDADPLRLSQVLANLLTNAAKYTDPGGHVEIEARLVDGALRIAVRDDGIGLGEASLGRIFGMFAQVESAREHADGGLGIGLALVRGLVELHGGTVSVRSAGPGAGSEFVVALPPDAVVGRRPAPSAHGAPSPS